MWYKIVPIVDDDILEENPPHEGLATTTNRVILHGAADTVCL